MCLAARALSFEPEIHELRGAYACELPALPTHLQDELNVGNEP